MTSPLPTALIYGAVYEAPSGRLCLLLYPQDQQRGAERVYTFAYLTRAGLVDYDDIVELSVAAASRMKEPRL